MWPPTKQELWRRTSDAPPRRFPLPWTVRSSASAYWIEDAEGKKFAFTYFEERVPPIGTEYASRLTRREALMIVRNISKLPELLGKG